MILRTAGEISAALEILSRSSAIGCDTETSGLSAKTARIYSIQFSDGENSFLLPVSEGVSTEAFTDLFADDSVVKIFHNARFDLEFLRAAGIAVENIFDTLIAEKILTKGANQSVSLAETLYRYFAVDLDKSQRAKFTKKWNGVWSEDLVNYALADVAYLPKLMDEQQQWLARLGLSDDFSIAMEKLITS